MKLVPPVRKQAGQEPPGLAEQVGNLLASAARFVASGLKFSTKEEAAARLAVCTPCPQYNLGRCNVCGCFLVAKVVLKEEKCPIGKW